jgi:hypothetical protein
LYRFQKWREKGYDRTREIRAFYFVWLATFRSIRFATFCVIAADIFTSFFLQMKIERKEERKKDRRHFTLKNKEKVRKKEKIPKNSIG